MVFVDALTRSIAGVTSFYESVKQESFQNKRFDYPHYTQPREFRGLKVPELLLSGNHQRIKEWRDKKAEEITRKNRPDLLEEEDRR
jgi:tRNA (guanine37-N1)-methyltransferase